MRSAVAVDGQKRVWVFWSAQKNGNFDIYAKGMLEWKMVGRDCASPAIPERI